MLIRVFKQWSYSISTDCCASLSDAGLQCNTSVLLVSQGLRYQAGIQTTLTPMFYVGQCNTFLDFTDLVLEGGVMCDVYDTYLRLSRTDNEFIE